MSYDRMVYESISTDTGIPGARLFWGPMPPEPPYFTYEVRQGSMFADNENYASVPRYRVRLFQTEPDQGVMSRFEGAVASLGTYVRHPDEREDGAFVTTYDLNVLGRPE